MLFSLIGILILKFKKIAEVMLNVTVSLIVLWQKRILFDKFAYYSLSLKLRCIGFYSILQ